MTQHALNWDESKHPQDELGDFAAKGTKSGQKNGTTDSTPFAHQLAFAPPRQSLMFDANATKRLFEGALLEAAKKPRTAKPVEGPSLLETIEDDLTKQVTENKPLGGQREMFSRLFSQAVSRYAKGHWVTIHGAHVFIQDGKITYGPPKLKGQPASAAMALAHGKPSHKPAGTPTERMPKAFSHPLPKYNPEWLLPSLESLKAKSADIPDDIWFAEWEGDLHKAGELSQQLQPVKRFRAAVKTAAQQAAEAVGAPVQDVLHLMPEAHKFLKAQQHDRENAKAALRKVSGLNAGHLARMENQYLDHSTVPHWDTTSREFALNHPDLGFDADGDDTPAEVWDFLREGKAAYIPAHDPRVAELAADWARPKTRSTQRQAREEADIYQPASDLYPRSGEVVPFSRIRSSVRRLSRLFESTLRRCYSAVWDESKHPRGQPENAGEFVESGHQQQPDLEKLADVLDRRAISNGQFKKQYGVELFKQVQQIVGRRRNPVKYMTPEQRQQYLDEQQKKRQAELAAFQAAHGGIDWAAAVREKDSSLDRKALEESGVDWIAEAKNFHEEGLSRDQIIDRFLEWAQNDQQQIDSEQAQREQEEAEAEQHERDEQRRHDPDYIGKKIALDAEIAARWINNTQDREERHRWMADVQMKDAHDILVASGWNPEYVSGSGSVYYRKGNEQFRISDHEVPETAERSHNRENGGFSWSSSSNNLVLPVEDVNSEIRAMLNPVVDDENDD